MFKTLPHSVANVFNQMSLENQRDTSDHWTSEDPGEISGVYPIMCDAVNFAQKAGDRDIYEHHSDDGEDCFLFIGTLEEVDKRIRDALDRLGPDDEDEDQEEDD